MSNSKLALFFPAPDLPTADQIKSSLNINDVQLLVEDKPYPKILTNSLSKSLVWDLMANSKQILGISLNHHPKVYFFSNDATQEIVLNKFSQYQPCFINLDDKFIEEFCSLLEKFSFAESGIRQFESDVFLDNACNTFQFTDDEKNSVAEFQKFEEAHTQFFRAIKEKQRLPLLNLLQKGWAN